MADVLGLSEYNEPGGADDDDDDNQTNPLNSSSINSKINLAPEVYSTAIVNKRIDPYSHQLDHNPTSDALWAPIQGPVKPFERDTLYKATKNHLIGFVEDAALNDWSFSEQHHGFRSLGTTTKGEKRKRLPSGDPSSEFLGPWAPYEVAEDEPEVPAGLTEEQKQLIESNKKKAKLESNKEGLEGGKSILHIKELRDYQGRTFVDHPTDKKPTPHESFMPKKFIHTWSGHTKGVSAIRFFPKYGHLLLSAGMDNVVKIWDVYNSGKCIRTYMGHSKAARDICFSYDGRKFLSCGYDRYTKLWDTETGECLGSFTNGKTPYCVKFNPDEDKQDLFLVGGSDKKIIQWDVRSKHITQEYDQHLGAVNTITFIDSNRRFVTSSDDKSLRVWDFGIPVVIKYISEPHMHSMPAITVHPNSSWFAAQSLDNQILIYSTKDRFKLNKKKRFMGHVIAGYACQVSFSPDGKFVISGDGEGKLWIWDWKSSKVLKTMRAHEGVAIGCEWHPISYLVLYVWLNCKITAFFR